MKKYGDFSMWEIEPVAAEFGEPDFSQREIIPVSSDFGSFGDFEEYIITENMGKYKLADFQRGMRILKAYHNAASASDNYNLTFDQFLDVIVRNNEFIGPRTKSYDILVAGIGEIPTLLGKSEAWAIDTVQTLAYNGDGKVPQSYHTLEAAMRQEHLNNPSWAEAAKYVTVNTAKAMAASTANALQATGDIILSTAKVGKYMIPVVAASAVGILLYALYKNSSAIGKSVEKVGDAAADRLRGGG